MIAIRRIAAAVLVLVVGVLLAACATIPISGPVRTAVPQQQQPDDAPVFTPNGPADGMKPEDVVRGFVQAQGAGRGYRVAKEFLTAGFAKDWRPDQRVLVHSVPWETKTLRGGDRVQLRVQAVAEVDALGRLTPTTRSETSTYSLQQVKGQWRISDGPVGVVLFQGVFTGVFANATLQFFDPSYRRLVPDVRWFPTDGDRAGDVVRAVLAGPAPPLQQVVAPVFPTGTALAAPVRTANGVVSVSVTIPGARPSEAATDRMQQALAYTLRGGSSANLDLVVNGRQAPAASQPVLEQPSITDPVVVADGRFGSLTSQGALREDRDLGPRIASLKPQAVTVSARQRLAAVLTRGGDVALVTRQGDPRTVDTRAGLVPPSLDQSGWTWSVPEDDPDALWVISSSGSHVALGSSLGVTSVRSIEVSTDGTRLLVLGQTESGYKAFVAGILRSSDGTPLGLTTDQYPISISSGGAVDATWLDTSDVAVLTTTSGSAYSIAQQQLGGISTNLGALSNALTIVGATGASDLRVLNGSGQIVRRSSTGVWGLEFPTSLEVQVLAVQR